MLWGGGGGGGERRGNRSPDQTLDRASAFVRLCPSLKRRLGSETALGELRSWNLRLQFVPSENKSIYHM